MLLIRALAASVLLLAFAAPIFSFAADVSVPYVPTPQSVVERMLEVAKVGARDYLIDLGSGDGRIVVTAARKYGTRGFGVDLNPTRISEANANAAAAKVVDKVQFFQQDLFETDLEPASVVTMYLLPQVNLTLRPKLLELKPGTRVVSHDFSMGDWKPELHEEMEAKDKYGGTGGRSDIYMWIIPAKVAGSWISRLQVRGKPVDYQIALNQQYQMIDGTARVGTDTVKLQNARVSGDQLSFEFTANIDGAPIRHAFNGTVYGSQVSGTADLSGAKLQARLEWNGEKK